MWVGEMTAEGLFMMAIAAACFSFPALYGWYRGQTLAPVLWVAWGWICGELALAGAMYIGGMGQ